MIDELPKVLTAEEVCDLLRMPRDQKTRRSKLRQLIAEGKLHSLDDPYRFQLMRFSRDRVLAYIDGEQGAA